MLKRMDHLKDPPAIDWTDCPLVEINPRKLSGAPILKGTRMPADVVLENYQGGSSVEEIAEDFDIPETSIRSLLAYAAMRNVALKQ
jgi:uncharacterized protein (DUF433 family)